MAAMIDIFGNHDDISNEERLIRPTWELPFWFLLTFMESTSVDEHPYLFHQLLLLTVKVSIIVIPYLTLIRLIVVSFFGLLGLVLPVWYPGPDTHTKSIWRIILRCPKHSLQEHCWNRFQKRYNFQWALTRVYPFRLRHFQYQPPDMVQKDHGPKANMHILLSVSFISSGVERWCHKWARLISASPTAPIIRIHLICVRR